LTTCNAVCKVISIKAISN